MMVNDAYQAGRRQAGGHSGARRRRAIGAPRSAVCRAGLGQQTYPIDFHVPQITGPCILKAAAYADEAAGADRQSP